MVLNTKSGGGRATVEGTGYNVEFAKLIPVTISHNTIASLIYARINGTEYNLVDAAAADEEMLLEPGTEIYLFCGYSNVDWYVREAKIYKNDEIVATRGDINTSIACAEYSYIVPDGITKVRISGTFRQEYDTYWTYYYNIYITES